MITVTDLGLHFGGDKLFDNVNLKFTPGNCYGVIGANGAGKSTFLRILSGDLESTSRQIIIPANMRMSVLKQDHFAFDNFTVMDTVIMGNTRLYEIMQEKEVLYAKEDFTDEDGIKASELEGEFAEMDGWNAEMEVSLLLQGLGIETGIHYEMMSSLQGGEKVKVLLAQALFGQPEIVLLDEPTNHLDVESIAWLEEFLFNFIGTVIVVSHDRHFLNTVCTHTVDVDYGKIKMFVGNYDFWYESSQMIQMLMKDQNRKSEDKIKELERFIERFSANKSKSKQATSRKKLIEKLTVDDLPTSSRRYPWVAFKPDREIGKDTLMVQGISKTVDGVKVLNNVSFILNRDDKAVVLYENEQSATTLFQILAGEVEPDEGTYKWGVSTTQSYFPKDNTEYFDECQLNLAEWLRQYASDDTESYLRTFLGRMLFSGDEVLKKVNVLSGGEKVRCMLSRMMLKGSNALIMDQPTNHLDLETITAVNDGLIAFKGAIVFSSHDHQFIQTIANRVVEITADGCIDRAMNYDEYLETKKR